MISNILIILSINFAGLRSCFLMKGDSVSQWLSTPRIYNNIKRMLIYLSLGLRFVNFIIQFFIAHVPGQLDFIVCQFNVMNFLYANDKSGLPNLQIWFHPFLLIFFSFLPSPQQFISIFIYVSRVKTPPFFCLVFSFQHAVRDGLDY